jgi:hypothetical protein
VCMCVAMLLAVLIGSYPASLGAQLELVHWNRALTMTSRGELWAELHTFLLGQGFTDMPAFSQFAELFPPQYR